MKTNMSEKTIRERLKSGELLFGTEVDLCDPCITEMTGRMGYDFIWIDTEHEAIDYHTALMHIIAAKAAGTASFVRIPQNEPYLAKRILEMGPDGIIFPMINNEIELKKAMDSCLYPPDGTRGFGPRRAANYGAEDMDEYISGYKDSVLRFAQIESEEAALKIDAMCKVPFVDGFIFGPCDLSGTVGRLNDIKNPKVLSLIDNVIEKCRSANIPVGIAIGSDSEEDIKFWLDRGIQFVSAGSDISAIVSANRARINIINKLTK